MRPDKFTQKMQEALQAAQDVASQFNQQETTNEHSLLVLLDQTVGVARPLRASSRHSSGQPVKASGVITYNFILQ